MQNTPQPYTHTMLNTTPPPGPGTPKTHPRPPLAALLPLLHSLLDPSSATSMSQASHIFTCAPGPTAIPTFPPKPFLPA